MSPSSRSEQATAVWSGFGGSYDGSNRDRRRKCDVAVRDAEREDAS